MVPAEQHVFARFLGRWQGVTTRRRGLEALIDAIEVLQGAELIASDLETRDSSGAGCRLSSAGSGCAARLG